MMISGVVNALFGDKLTCVNFSFFDDSANCKKKLVEKSSQIWQFCTMVQTIEGERSYNFTELISLVCVWMVFL